MLHQFFNLKDQILGSIRSNSTAYKYIMKSSSMQKQISVPCWIFLSPSIWLHLEWPSLDVVYWELTPSQHLDIETLEILEIWFCSLSMTWFINFVSLSLYTFLGWFYLRWSIFSHYIFLPFKHYIEFWLSNNRFS